MRDKLIMLGYNVYEYNERICIAQNKIKKTLLVLKDGKEISDCPFLNSKLYDITEVELTKYGGMLYISLFYSHKFTNIHGKK